MTAGDSGAILIIMGLGCVIWDSYREKKSAPNESFLLDESVITEETDGLISDTKATV